MLLFNGLYLFFLV